jgi:hypothetical protein
MVAYPFAGSVAGWLRTPAGLRGHLVIATAAAWKARRSAGIRASMPR